MKLPTKTIGAITGAILSVSPAFADCGAASFPHIVSDYENQIERDFYKELTCTTDRNAVAKLDSNQISFINQLGIQIVMQDPKNPGPLKYDGPNQTISVNPFWESIDSVVGVRMMITEALNEARLGGVGKIVYTISAPGEGIKQDGIAIGRPVLGSTKPAAKPL